MTTTHPPPMVITIAGLKGGGGKSTSAAFLAHALHELGHRVLAVDGDPQASLLHWHERAGFPFPVVGHPSAKLHRDLDGIVGDRYDVVVVDTPPTEHGRRIALSALRACTHALVPIAPTPLEYDRTDDVRILLEEATELRPGEHPPATAALINRTVANAASTEVCREALVRDGWTVLRATIPRLELYAQAGAGPIERAMNTGYGDAARELLDAPTTVKVPR